MRTIFNTTFIINETIEKDWIAFMREHYISYLHLHKLTKDILFTKVSIDQPEGKTYSLQLVFDTFQAMEYFLKHHLSTIEEKLITHYKNNYLCFSSTLTEI